MHCAAFFLLLLFVMVKTSCQVPEVPFSASVNVPYDVAVYAQEAFGMQRIAMAFTNTYEKNLINNLFFKGENTIK